MTSSLRGKLEVQEVSPICLAFCGIVIFNNSSLQTNSRCNNHRVYGVRSDHERQTNHNHRNLQRGSIKILVLNICSLRCSEYLVLSSLGYNSSTRFRSISSAIIVLSSSYISHHGIPCYSD